MLSIWWVGFEEGSMGARIGHVWFFFFFLYQV